MKNLRDFFDPQKILIEQAATLKDYRLLLQKFKVQIVENFCLVYYAIKHPEIYPYPSNKKHWENELKTYLNDIRTTSLKSKADVKEVIKRELIGIADLDNPNKICQIIQEKFEEEHFEVEFDCCQHFVDCLDDLILCLANEISMKEFLLRLKK